MTPSQVSERLAEIAIYVDSDTVAAVLEIAHAEYWSVAEVAGLTRLSTRTVRRACAEGRVPALKIRGQWRVAVGPGQLRLL